MPSKPPPEIRLSDGNLYVPVLVQVHRDHDHKFQDLTTLPEGHKPGEEDETTHVYVRKDVVQQ